MEIIGDEPCPTGGYHLGEKVHLIPANTNQEMLSGPSNGGCVSSLAQKGPGEPDGSEAAEAGWSQDHILRPRFPPLFLM